MLFKIIFFTFYVFVYIIMYTLKISRPIKQMSVNEIRDYIFENYYKQTGFSQQSGYSMKRLKRKDLLLFANKLI